MLNDILNLRRIKDILSLIFRLAFHIQIVGAAV